MWRMVVETVGLALPNGGEIKMGRTQAAVNRRKRFVRDRRLIIALDLYDHD